MISSEHCELLTAEIDRLVALVRDGDRSAAVPTCPGWDLARLAGHVGATHRWVTAMVETGAIEPLRYRPFREATPSDADALPDWLAEGGAALVRTLTGTAADRPVWNWLPDGRPGLWTRRMLHETLVHRADAEIALGARPEIATGLADDGVDEFLELLPYVGGRNPGFAQLRGDGQTIGLLAEDTGEAWVIRLTEDGFTWRRGHPDGNGGTGATGGTDSGTGPDPLTAAVTAPVADLLLFAWGRRKPGEAGVRASGDPGLLGTWVRGSSL